MRGQLPGLQREGQSLKRDCTGLPLAGFCFPCACLCMRGLGGRSIIGPSLLYFLVCQCVAFTSCTLGFCEWIEDCADGSNYFADAYETYSSSAQAAQSFARNLFSAVFPLFCRDMYMNLGYPVASTLVAAVGTVLGFAPVLIMVYGKRLRARSKVTSAIWNSQ